MGRYRAVSDSKHIEGISLMRLVSEIQLVSNLSSLTSVNYYYYYNYFEIGSMRCPIREMKPHIPEILMDLTSFVKMNRS
jgi:hypothetical protein